MTNNLRGDLTAFIDSQIRVAACYEMHTADDVIIRLMLHKTFSQHILFNAQKQLNPIPIFCFGLLHIPDIPLGILIIHGILIDAAAVAVTGKAQRRKTFIDGCTHHFLHTVFTVTVKCMGM